LSNDGKRPSPDTEETRPFRVLGVQQIALGSLDRRALEALWIGALGLAPTGRYRSDAENVDEVILQVGGRPWGVEIDLMQPIDPQRKPKVHQPALNHVGLWVDDLKAAYDWLMARGVRFAPGGIRRGAGGHDVCFIHPKSSSEFPIAGAGALIELVQAPSELLAARAT
jgi:lactoylglutathione lyase